MRGSYQWAMLRLAILAAFIIPAALMNPSAHSSTHSSSWLAAVDVAEPVLALHQVDASHTTLPAEVIAEIKQSAALASQAQQEAMRALRKELARELIRMRQQRSETTLQSKS
jgi:hypothetical protein